MSNRNQIEQEVLTNKFVSEWVPKFPNTPVKYENRNFTPPVNQPWAAFSIRSGRVAEAAISGIMPRGIGLVYLQIFLPENAGTLIARQMTDALADVFDNWHYVYAASGNYPRGDFWFKRVEVVPSPMRDGWLQWTASVEFKHDEQIITYSSGAIPDPLTLKRACFPVFSVVANGATALSWANGEMQNISLTGDAQISVLNWPMNALAKMTLFITNTGAFNVTAWPAGTVWQGGVTPTITQGAGKRDIIVLMTPDAGGLVYGSIAGQDYR